MRKFTWSLFVVSSLTLFGCADDMSVPDDAISDWDKSAVSTYMNTCTGEYDATGTRKMLDKVMDLRATCRCTLEKISPLMSYAEFRTTKGPNGMYAKAFRDCRDRNLRR